MDELLRRYSMKGAKDQWGKLNKKRNVHTDDSAYDFSDYFAYYRYRCFVCKFINAQITFREVKL